MKNLEEQMEQAEQPENSTTLLIREEFAAQNNMHPVDLNEFFEADESFRQKYLDYYAKRYPELMA